MLPSSSQPRSATAAQPVKLLLDGLRLDPAGGRHPRIHTATRIRHLLSDQPQIRQGAFSRPAHQQLIGLIPPALAVATRLSCRQTVQGRIIALSRQGDISLESRSRKRIGRCTGSSSAAPAEHNKTCRM
jgi:hypothetical protein